MDEKHVYDTIIIGAGPAGLTAGIYAGRAAMDTLIIEKDQIGGQVTTTSVVWNYPAVKDVDGTKLVNLMQEQVNEFGVKIIKDDVVSFDLTGDVKKISGKKDYFARSIIFATGANPKKAGFEGEDRFRGHGVAYCSTCDGELFSGLDVFVIGGGYSAAEEADYLTKFVRHVTVIVRGNKFTCASLTAAKAIDNPKVTIVYDTVLRRVSGSTYLNQAEFFNKKSGQTRVYNLKKGDETFGVFVFVGTKPNSDHIKDFLNTDEQGYVITDNEMQTNLRGIFAAGDLVAKPLKQIVTATSDGAAAASAAEEYVASEKRRLNIPIKPVQKKIFKQTPSQQTPIDDEQRSLVKTHEGQWFTGELRKQLTSIFLKINKEITLLVLDDASSKGEELKSFVSELSNLDDHLNYEVKRARDDEGLLPALELLDENHKQTGIRFSGIPTGHELNSLVLAIYNLAGPGQSIDGELIERIEKLPGMHLQIGVSLTCHFCPDVVAASQKIASINPDISAEMIDLQLFPKLRKAKKIMSVPAFMINDGEVTFGSQTLDQIVGLCERQTEKV